MTIRWKASGEQYDDRVVEVVWDQHRDTWKMLRFRDDKREGNYKTVVTSIIKSIKHGVEAEQVRLLFFDPLKLRRSVGYRVELELISRVSLRNSSSLMLD